jgi:hypothetical protein
MLIQRKLSSLPHPQYLAALHDPSSAEEDDENHARDIYTLKRVCGRQHGYGFIYVLISLGAYWSAIKF